MDIIRKAQAAMAGQPANEQQEDATIQKLEQGLEQAGAALQELKGAQTGEAGAEPTAEADTGSPSAQGMA